MNRTTRIILVVAAALVVLAGAGILWFFSGDEPDEVGLEAATEQLTDPATSATEGTSDASSSTEPADIDGTWSVDTNSGDFDYETATGTFAGFRIEEELAQIGSTTAVGRTGDVSGELTVEGTTVTGADFRIDMTTITTNESRRDDNVQDALETSEFPDAAFSLVEPIELPEEALLGEPVEVAAQGEMTIHGETRPVTVALEAQLVDDTIVVVGSTEVTFSDFGVEVPSSPLVLSVQDHGTVEMQLLLTRS